MSNRWPFAHIFLCAAISFCALSAAWPAAGQTALAPPGYKGVLPEDIVLHAATGPLEKSIDAVESFLTSAFQTTPMAAALQPGSLRNLITSGLPAEFLDMEAGVHFIAASPSALSPVPAFGVILPVSDFAGKLAAIEQMQYRTQNLGQNTYSVTSPQNKQAFVTDAGKGSIAAADSAEAARYVARVFRSHADEFLKTSGSHALVITLDLGKILALNSQAMDAALGIAMLKVQEVAARPDVADATKALVQLAPPYLSRLKQFLMDLKSVRIYVYADDAAIRMSGFLTPREGTPLRRMAEAYEKTTPSSTLVKYLPAETTAAVCLNLNKEATADFRSFIAAFWGDLAGAVMGEEDGARQKETIARFMELAAGEVCKASLSDPSKPAPTSVGYMALSDGDAYRKMLAEFAEPAQEIVNAVCVAAQTPFQLKAVFTENAGQAGDVAYSRFAWNVVPVAGQGGTDEPVVAIMRDMMKQQAVHIAVVGNVAVFSNGPDATAALASAIGALKNKTPRLGANAEFMSALEAARSRQICFASIYPLDILKTIMMQSAAMNPRGAAIAEALKTIPKSTRPVTISVGAAKGSPKFTVEVPSAAVSETVQAGASVLGQIMMMQMQPALEAPAVEPEGE